MRKINEYLFTSYLDIYILDNIKNEKYIDICIFLKSLNSDERIQKLNKFNKNNILNNKELVCSEMLELSKKYKIHYTTFINFIYYNNEEVADCQGFLKGYAIQLIMELLKSKKINNYIINWGGDIVINIKNNTNNLNIVSNCDKFLESINTNKKVFMTIFTSSNIDKNRGHHIKGDNKTNSATVVREYERYKDINPILSDIVSTLSVANKDFRKPGYKIIRSKVNDD